MAYAGFQFLPLVLLVVKSSSKKVQITSLMHIAVAPSNNNSDASIVDPRSCLTLRRVRLATLLRKASFGRLHIIWLNGSTSTTTTATAPVQQQSSSRHNNNDNMQQKRCLFCTDPQKVQLRIELKEEEDAGGEGDTRAGKKCRRRLLHSQMCSDMLAVATLLHGNGPRAAAEVAVPSLESFSLTHSLTSASMEYFN